MNKQKIANKSVIVNTANVFVDEEIANATRIYYNFVDELNDLDVAKWDAIDAGNERAVKALKAREAAIGRRLNQWVEFIEWLKTPDAVSYAVRELVAA